MRTKKELRELYKTSNLVVDIKRRRLEWLEHANKKSVINNYFRVRQR
jgi:hypothetical protein